MRDCWERDLPQAVEQFKEGLNFEGPSDRSQQQYFNAQVEI